MDWDRARDRLWLLSMMSLGCAGGDDEVDPEPASTTGTTTAAMDDDTSTGGPSVDGTGTSTGMSSGSDDDTGTSTSVSTTSGSSSDGADSSSGDSTTAADSSSGDSSGETTMGVQASPFVEACVALYVTYGDCGGYAYPPAQLLAYCEQSEAYLEMYYDAACGPAQLDYFACLSELPCMTLLDFAAASAACSEPYMSGMEVCPELFPLCQGGGGGAGPGGCTVETFDCIDGNDYAVDCAMDQCTCTINGVGVGGFMTTGEDPCSDDGFEAMVVASCGFPEGVFFF